MEGWASNRFFVERTIHILSLPRNKISRWRVLRNMWANPQESADLLYLLKKSLTGVLIFCAVYSSKIFRIYPRTPHPHPIFTTTTGGNLGIWGWKNYYFFHQLLNFSITWFRNRIKFTVRYDLIVFNLVDIVFYFFWLSFEKSVTFLLLNYKFTLKEIGVLIFSLVEKYVYKQAFLLLVWLTLGVCREETGYTFVLLLSCISNKTCFSGTKCWRKVWRTRQVGN